MRLAVKVWEQRGDLMSFQDECIMAAKYMMNKKSSGHKEIDYFYDEDSPYGFKLAQAWDIGDGVYLGFTDYRYIIDSTTHNNCVKWSYGTKSITYTDSDGTTKSRSFEGYIYERYYYSYMCFGSTDNIDGQPWMITTDLPNVVEIMKQTRVMDADGYIYADIYNLRQLDPSANIVMTPGVYTHYTKRDLAEYYIPNKRKPRMYYTSSILNPCYGADDEHIGIVTYNYAAASRGYINIRSETKPDNDDAKKDEFGTWTVKIEIKPPDNPIYNNVFSLPDPTRPFARWTDIAHYNDVFNNNFKKIQNSLFKINRIYAEEAKVYIDDKREYITMPSFEYIGDAANQPSEINIPSYESIGAFSKGVWPSLYPII